MHKKKSKKAGRKKNTNHDSLDFGKYIVSFLLLVSFSLIVISVVIFIKIYIDEKDSRKPIAVQAEKKIDTLMEKMDEIVKQAPKKDDIPLESDDYEYAQKTIEPQKEKPQEKPEEKPQELIEEKKPKETPEEKPKPVYKPEKKPKLAIIIDDVSSYGEVDKLKKTKLSLSLSLFPPTDNFPSTPKIARELDFFMIHLPLEALNFNSPQDRTLTINSSEVEIMGRIKQIRRLFPSAAIINNHTGSKFTADKEAMIKLMRALKEYDFEFVDSRTIGNSKAVEAGNFVNKKILTRDVFLDNVQDVSYIKEQLGKAVKIAKKNGYAIAIGHPRQKTIEALMDSSGILKDVEVVYVKELL